MAILVVGTSGQLATELYRRAERDVALLPRQKLDVSDATALTSFLDSVSPSAIINASAYTAVDRAEQERERAFAVNAAGPRTLARWCAQHGAALIHVSTDYVFDGRKPAAYVETDTVGPLNVYGESKLAGEQAIREELDRHLIFRTSWVFSAHGHNFVKTMLRLAGERDELRIVADQRGRPTAAADLAGALWRIVRERLVAERDIAWGTYHLANADAVSWHEFAETIVQLQSPSSGRLPRVIPISGAEYPTPAIRPANSVLNTTHFAATFGFELRSFREPLAETLTELQVSRTTH